jgi:outer membrane lipoprotein-sorting protein
MIRQFAILTAAVLMSDPGSARADEPQDIIAKAIKAHGGEELLAKHKAAQSKTKGKITLPGVGETDFSQELSYMLPDKFKDQMELKVGGQAIGVLTIVNGDKVTLEVNGTAVDQAEKVRTAIKEAAHMIEVARLITLKDKAYELSLIGDDKVDGRKVVGVRVSKKGAKDVSLYFDKETGLIAKIEFRATDDTGNEVAEERFPSGYEKNKEGVPVPKKVVVKRDGKVFLEAEVLETRSYEKLDDSEFKK